MTTQCQAFSKSSVTNRNQRNFQFHIVIIAFASFFFVEESFSRTAGDKNQVEQFIFDMNRKHGFSKSNLTKKFRQLKIQKRALKLNNPSKNQKKIRDWPKYRDIFLNSRVISTGKEFFFRNEKTLKRASKLYGVPSKILMGIIGVETRYGKVTGDFPVLDTLFTLAFENTRREVFFRNELEQLLLVGRESKLDITTLKSSFAGALGIPQFMPSSIRSFAVDFDRDGKVDILNSESDAIGSVANYLSKHGWERGDLTHAVALIAVGSNPTKYLAKNLTPSHSINLLRSAGILDKSKVLPPNQAVSLIDLPRKNKKDIYWIATKNFFSITMYNRSYMYAAAVIKLGERISAEVNTN